MTRRVDSMTPRVCRACERELPAEHFYASGTGNGRRRTCIARGEVWCNNCARYLSAEEFKRHPQRPHTYWSYCKACVIEIDRMRYRAKAKTPAGQEATRRRGERHRRQMAAEYRARRMFVRDAIDTVRRRGFTISEVARLSGIAVPSLYAYLKDERRPIPAAASRMLLVLRATAHLPTGEAPPYRRQRPHPELAGLLERLAPEIARHPTRSAWVGDRQRRGQACAA